MDHNHHTVLPARLSTNGMNHPAFTRKHSPDGATRARVSEDMLSFACLCSVITNNDNNMNTIRHFSY